MRITSKEFLESLYFSPQIVRHVRTTRAAEEASKKLLPIRKVRKPRKTKSLCPVQTKEIRKGKKI